MSGGEKKRIELKVFATLRNLIPPRSTIELPESADIAALLTQAGLPPEKAAIIFVNGRHAELESVPAEGDVISVFPPVGGG